jgi:hypothetical protein
MEEVSHSLAQEVAALIPGGPRWPPALAGPVSDLEVEAVERELRTVLPRSYKAFLRHCGAARIRSHELFGLPRNGLWGDVVLMNQLTTLPLPPSCVMIGQDREGRAYCLDTGRMNEEGECPVVVFSAGLVGDAVAPSFLDFLACLSLGVH